MSRPTNNPNPLKVFQLEDRLCPAIYLGTVDVGVTVPPPPPAPPGPTVPPPVNPPAPGTM